MCSVGSNPTASSNQAGNFVKLQELYEDQLDLYEKGNIHVTDDLFDRLRQI